VTGHGDREGSTNKEVAMRPIRTIAPLALGLVALAVAGCQNRPDQPTPPKPKPAPDPETIVGLWPVRTLEQARILQDRADAGHQPWLRSPELVATSYGAAELGLYQPVARRGGANADAALARALHGCLCD
jgi:hypothetical protein